MFSKSHVLTVLLAFVLLYIQQAESQNDTTNSSSTVTMNTTNSLSTVTMNTTDSSSNVTSTISTTVFSSVSTSNDTNSTMSTISTPTTNAMATSTIASTTTARPTADQPYDTDMAAFALMLTVGHDNTSDIQYNNASATRETLLTKLRLLFGNEAFSVDLIAITNNMQNPYTLKVKYLQRNYVNGTTKLENDIINAINKIAADNDFSLLNSTLIEIKVAEFANMTSNICYAEDICPLSFTCNYLGCQHVCTPKDCSGHGSCYASVSINLTVTTICQCDSGYEKEYTGDNCEYSRRGRLQIIAIIAGVLGAACLVFFLIIVVMCCRQRRSGSSTNYNIAGASYGNSAYDNHNEK